MGSLGGIKLYGRHARRLNPRASSFLAFKFTAAVKKPSQEPSKYIQYSHRMISRKTNFPVAPKPEPWPLTTSYICHLSAFHHLNRLEPVCSLSRWNGPRLRLRFPGRELKALNAFSQTEYWQHVSQREENIRFFSSPLWETRPLKELEMDQPQQTSSSIPAAFSKLAFSPFSVFKSASFFDVWSRRAKCFLPLFLSFCGFPTSASESLVICNHLPWWIWIFCH